MPRVEERIRAEYEDHPTLSLTPSQLQRLVAGTPQETAAALECLLRQGFLRRTQEGYLVGAPRPRPPVLAIEFADSTGIDRRR